MNQNKKIIRNLAVGFIAFMCTTLLVALTMIFIIEKTLFSADFLNKAAVQSNYYSELTKQINTQIQDFGLGSGLPATILEDVASPQQVQKDFEAYTNQAYYGNNITIEKEPFLAQIKAPITAYADEKKQVLTPESQAGIDRFAERSYETYSDFIKLPFLPALGQQIQLFASNLTLFKVVIGSSFVLLLMLIIYLLHWWWHRLIRHLSFIFGGGGLMLIIVPALILTSGMIERISITSKPLYQLLTTYLTNSLLVFIIVGGAFLVASVLAAIISQIQRKHS